MADLPTAMKQSSSRTGGKTLLALFGVLFLIGIVSWIVQLTQGLETLAIGPVVAWGVYIAAFFLLAGTGGGMLILGAGRGFGMASSPQKWPRCLHIAALACLAAAGFMILMDLGRPARVWNMLLRPNFSSMFVWDFYLLALAAVLGLLCLFRKPGKMLASLTALAGLAVVLAEGLILTVSAGKPFWHNPLIPIVFLLEALIAALAILLILNPERRKDRLAEMLAGCLAILLIFTLVDMITAMYTAKSDGGAGMRLLLSGSLAPLYWFQILLCVVGPLGLLFLRKGSGMTRLAGILALIGVFMAKINLLLAGQSLSFTGAEVSYTPTLVEAGGFIGGLGLAAFLFLAGTMIFTPKADA